MFALFHALTERLKALFITTAALDFEADLLARDAERRAELLRQADRYDSEEMHGIAEHLRRQADILSLQRPLAGVLPAVEHLLGEGQRTGNPSSPVIPAQESPTLLPFNSARSKAKKKGK